MRPDSGRRPFWDRRTVPAGVVIAVIIGLLVWVVATRGGGGHHVALPTTTQQSPASSVASSAPTTARPTPTASTSSGCHVAAGSQAIPQYAPLGITWQLYQTVALPYSKTAGPMVVNGGVARCYAHDPLGALLAVSQIGVRYLLAPDWQRVVALQVMPGNGRDAYLKIRARYGDAPASDQPGEYDQLAGFKFVTYSPAVAVIELALKSDSGALQASPTTVDWSNGDWKLQLQPNGTETAQILPISSLVGFAAWSGV